MLPGQNPEARIAKRRTTLPRMARNPGADLPLGMAKWAPYLLSRCPSSLPCLVVTAQVAITSAKSQPQSCQAQSVGAFRPGSRHIHLRRSRTPENTILHVRHLSRNVAKEHLDEIFGKFGKIRSVERGHDKEVCPDPVMMTT